MKNIDRAVLSLEGLSVADAFGEQLLHNAGSARADALMKRQPPPAKRWMWTDDTAMAISVVDELRERGVIEPEQLAQRFARRYVGDPARGYGRGAHEVLAEIAQGTPYAIAAKALFNGQGSHGNGSAMRSAPIGAYFSGDMAAVVEQAGLSAAPTHAHPEGAAGAIAVAVAAAAVFAGERDGKVLLETVFKHTPAGPTRDAIRRSIGMLKHEAITVAAELGNGSNVLCADTVPFALWCTAAHLGDYVGALWSCGEVGGDIDTTCAMVGGVVIGATGLDAIPPAWRAAREPLPRA
jgi:ADP-ribosylglycohydrolase